MILRRTFYLIILLTVCTQSIMADNIIKVYSLDTMPVIDAADDWTQIPFTAVPLKSIQNHKNETRTILIKTAIHADNIYLFASWDDSKPGTEHKPFIWNNITSRYETGPEREDRLAIQFEIEGKYTTDWLAAKYFKTDMWHWRSSRSAPLNLMHDKTTIVSAKKMTRSRKLKSKDENDIYVKRPGNKGDKLYKTMRYGLYKGDKLPKYIFNPNASGSIADIKALSVWKNGKWFLEINRLLDTGHNDDVKFLTGSKVRAGLAVFDNSSNHDHFISNTLEFWL